MIDKMRYTLDRIEDGFYVFLRYPHEEEELLIPAAKIFVKLSEGDIVCIRILESDYVIEVLENETLNMKDKVTGLLDKLKNKK